MTKKNGKLSVEKKKKMHESCIQNTIKRGDFESKINLLKEFKGILEPLVGNLER